MVFQRNAGYVDRPPPTTTITSTAPKPEPLLLSWSGGKDSAFALARLRDNPAVHVVGLLTTVTSGYDRISIHGVRRALLERQAKCVGLPLHEVVIEPGCTKDSYEAAWFAAFDDCQIRCETRDGSHSATPSSKMFESTANVSCDD